MQTTEGAEMPNEILSTVITNPTPVEDLRVRLQILRDSGVRAYKDANLEIVFEARRVVTPEDIAMKAFLDAEAAARSEQS